MSETRQPTMDELRARLPVKGVKAHRGLYAGVAGTGPDGKTCHDCGWLRYTDPRGRAKHPKCGKTAYTHGDATTIRTFTPACHHFKPPATPEASRE